MATLLIVSVCFTGVMLFSSAAIAADKKVDLFPKDTRSESQKSVDRGMSDAKQAHDRQQQDKAREAMRDKTHDGIRYQFNDKTSVGPSYENGVPGGNVRITTP